MPYIKKAIIKLVPCNSWWWPDKPKYIYLVFLLFQFCDNYLEVPLIFVVFEERSVKTNKFFFFYWGFPLTIFTEYHTTRLCYNYFRHYPTTPRIINHNPEWFSTVIYVIRVFFYNCNNLEIHRYKFFMYCNNKVGI